MYLGEFIKRCDGNTELYLMARNDDGRNKLILATTPNKIISLLKLLHADRAIDWNTIKVECFGATNGGHIEVLLELDDDER